MPRCTTSRTNRLADISPRPGTSTYHAARRSVKWYDEGDGPLPPSPSPRRGGGAPSVAQRPVGKVPILLRAPPPRVGEGLGERSSHLRHEPRIARVLRHCIRVK